MKRLFTSVLLLLTASISQAGEWRGYVAAELLGFLEGPAHEDQHDFYGSISAEPEYFNEWKRGNDLFSF